MNFFNQHERHTSDTRATHQLFRLLLVTAIFLIGHFEVMSQIPAIDSLTGPVVRQSVAGFTCVDDRDTCDLVKNFDFTQNSVIYEYCNIAGLSADCEDQVCYWEAKRFTPLFCGNPSNSFVLAYWCEGIVTEEQLNLPDSSECIITLEYLITGDTFGPATNSELILGLINSNAREGGCNDFTSTFKELFVIDEPQIEKIGGYTDCITGDFGKLELQVSVGPNDPKFLYVDYKSQPFNDPDTKTSFAHIKSIQMSCCDSLECTLEPDFTFTTDTCSASFQGTNDGNLGDYYWDFGDGNTATGQNVNHTYAEGGSYKVCLEVRCQGSSEAGLERCRIVNINPFCSECEDVTQENPFPAYKCDPADDQEAYYANIRIPIDVDMMECPGSNLEFISNDAQITILDWFIERSNPVTIDHLVAEIEITPSSILNLPTCSSGAYIEISFALCNEADSTSQCYTFQVCGDECEDCMGSPLNATADCDQSQSTTNTFVYTGSITFNTQTLYGFNTSSTCGPNEIKGFKAPLETGSLTFTGTPNEWTFSYQLTTVDPNYSGTSVLLCFNVVGRDYCVPVDISIGNACPSGPPVCEREWTPKSMDCTDERTNGDIVFNVIKNLSLGSDQACLSGIDISIAPIGSIEINSSGVSGSTLSFDINIVMPAGYDQDELYYLKVELCDKDGNEICYLIPLFLICDGTGGNSSNLTAREIVNETDLLAYPNPGFDQITLSHSKILENEEYDIHLIDMHGRTFVFKSTATKSKVQVNLHSLLSGIYFIKLRRNNSTVAVGKIVLY